MSVYYNLDGKKLNSKEILTILEEQKKARSLFEKEIIDKAIEKELKNDNSKNNPIDTLLMEVEQFLMQKYGERYDVEGYSLIRNFAIGMMSKNDFKAGSKDDLKRKLNLEFLLEVDNYEWKYL